MITRLAKRKLAFLLALQLSLTACWETETSIIDPLDSDSSLQSGVYEFQSPDDPRGLSLDIDSFALMRFPGGGYIFDDLEENDGSTPLLAFEFEPNWHLIQAGIEGEMLLGITRSSPGRIELFNPSCDEETGTMRGVTRKKAEFIGHSCKFHDLEAAIAAAKMVKLRIESKEISEPIGWFNPLESRPLQSEREEE